MPLEIANAANQQPWWVLLSVGIFMIPFLLFVVWKWFLHGKAEATAAQISVAQGGIYKDAIADAKGIIDELKSQRDASEVRNSELLIKLADLSDRMVDMQAIMSRQTDKIRDQELQMKAQAEKIDLQANQLEMQTEKLSEATRTIEQLTNKIAILEGIINASPK